MAVFINKEQAVPIITLEGTVDGWGYMRSTLGYYLQECKKKNIRVRINSYGGDINEGMAIARMLEDYEGEVTVEFAGFNASAATWMAFGADSIEIRQDSLWLCHKSSVGVDIYANLNADQLKDTINKLKNDKKTAEALDLIIAQKYLEKCGTKKKNLKDVLDLMDEEKWMTADEVVAWGFADKLIPGINKITNEDRAIVLQNCHDLHIPAPSFDDVNPEKKPTPQASDEKEVSSLIQRIVSLFHTHADAENPKPSNEEVSPSNKIVMKEKFVQVCALLAMDAIEVVDGKVTVSVAQLQQIEDSLAQADAARKEVKKATDALDAISDNVKNTEGLANKVQVCKAVLDLIPSGMPVAATAPASEQKKDDRSDVAKDTINNFVKGM
jgi:ATP-dependent protease ClpP protease subunit